MSPLRPGGFQLRKWYLDCVADDGTAVVAYWARLRWGPLHLRYAAVLDAPAAGDPRQFHTLRPDAPPRVHGAECTWRCGRLGTTGTWTSRAPAVRRVLLRTDEGAIRWSCHQPAAAVRLEVRRRGEPPTALEGTGYVEELTLSMPPWRLPFDTLWWGRVVAAGTAVAWIRWRGGSRRGLVVLDGTVHRRVHVARDAVTVPGVVEVRLDGGRPLRDGPLGTNALRGVGALVELLPPAFRVARESKRISPAELRRPGHEPVRGWAIHEVVRW